MRIRWMSLALVALAVALVPATASAQQGEDEADIAHKFKGTVVSVDSAAGTVEVSTGKPGKCRGKAGVSQRRGRKGRGGRRGREAQTLTVSTDAATRIRRNKAAATLADLQEGDRVTVVILTDEETTLAEALAEPADVISAKAKPEPKPEEEEEQPAEEGETPAP